MTTTTPNNEIQLNFNDPQIRYKIFVERTDSHQVQLLQDIQLWADKLPKESVIKYHVSQFGTFCGRVFEQVQTEYSRSEEDTAFKSQVVGTLTTQWLLLREVASHRLDGSPYLDILDELDREVARYYRVLLQALPEKINHNLPKSTPLLFLGRAAELTFFNDQNQNPPAVISVPFGVAKDSPQSRSRLSIAHEVGHAIFNRVQPFLPEVKVKLRVAQSADTGLTRQQRVVRSVVTNWLGEIVADLVGMALAGPAFGESAFDVFAGPEAYLGVTDESHPLPIIRPYIYWEFLEYLEELLKDRSEHQALVQSYTQQSERLKTMIDGFSGRYLDRLFETMPALTKVTLAQVQQELRAITRFILENKFDALNQPDDSAAKSFGEILVTCAVNMNNANRYPLKEEKVDRENWGETIPIESPFVLDLSNMVPPTYATPVSLGDFIKCCVLRQCPCSIFG